MHAIHRACLETQRGIALVSSLLLLLVVTIIGISSMKSTLLTEKMAGNAKNHNIAFQAAETGLRNGEAWIRDSGPLPTMGDAQSDSMTGALYGVSNQPYYSMKLAYRKKDHLETADYVDTNVAKTDYYILEASGEGAPSSNAKVELQSVYVWRYETN